MSKITLQGTILISVIIICVSSIAIALITKDECRGPVGRGMAMFERMPPPPHMMRGDQRGGGFENRRQMRPPEGRAQGRAQGRDYRNNKRMSRRPQATPEDETKQLKDLKQ